MAALVSVLAVTAVLLAPGAFLLQRFFDEAVAGVRLIRHNLDPAVFPALAERNPYFATILHWLQVTFELNPGMKRAAAFLAGQAPTVISGSLQVITQSAMMLVTLFYLLRDHRRLLGFLLRIAPLSSTESQQLVNRVSETISATLCGNLTVKLVQGVLGGLMFWTLGLPAPLLFGILVSLLAMLPMVGTSLVWGSAAVVLIYQENWIKATIVVAWGGLVISVIDNLLYPFLVATELRFHTLGVLFAVFGGLVAFGLAGVSSDQ